MQAADSRTRRTLGLWPGLRMVFALTLTLASSASLAKTLHAYGPGGPAPAMKEIAQSYERRTGTKVIITAGPTPKWIAQARTNGDIIFSGSENMMTDFMRQLGPLIVADSIEPLYLRPSTILVRPGNPHAIRGIRDLAKPGRRIMVVGGAGQVGMWEDVVARTGDRELLARFRRNIAFDAKSSAEALEKWKSDLSIDSWLIWNHWQIANPKLADTVPVEKELTIWRPMDVGLMARAAKNPEARRFLAFLTSPEAIRIFERNGWSR